jgi:hypothetical protein
MTMEARNQYLEQLQREYLAAGSREGKSRLLDEAEKRTSLNRKYLTVKLQARTSWVKRPRKARVAVTTYHSDLILPLIRAWEIFGQPCGQRLAPLLTTEVPRLRQFGELAVSDEQARLLGQMSASTVDRLLDHEKAVRLMQARWQPKHPLLYQLVPTKLSSEVDRSVPGFIQTDGVEHCGASARGLFASTIDTVDPASYWWDGVAVMGLGQRETERALDEQRSRAPIPWRELHPDNGTSFLNWHLWRYAQRTKLELSRSRPYHKNDNCFVEQSNRTSVRDYVGHVRYDTPQELALLNELYGLLRQYKDFCQPVLRLKEKIRDKGHIRRRYEPATTPYQWLMAHPAVSTETKEQLRRQYQQLNPAQLRRAIDTTLDRLAATYEAKHQPTQETPVTKPARRLEIELTERPLVGLGVTVT